MNRGLVGALISALRIVLTRPLLKMVYPLKIIFKSRRPYYVTILTEIRMDGLHSFCPTTFSIRYLNPVEKLVLAPSEYCVCLSTNCGYRLDYDKFSY